MNTSEPGVPSPSEPSPHVSPVAPQPRLSGPEPSPTPPSRGPAYWARRLLVCNPFFLVSAAMLLYAVASVSADDQLFSSETSNLLFNFAALQAYGALLVFTAVRLSRRAIWYDSALLVVLEHGLALVPFLLLTQATFIAPALGFALVLLAALASTLRALQLRRGYPEFNLPARALQVGVGILLLNTLAPVMVHQVVDRTSVTDWTTPNQWIWAVVLPVCALSANLLPRPTSHGGRCPERPWLPIMILGLWLAGTAVHAWALGYVCGQAFSLSHLAPVLFTVTWTLFRRATDFLPAPCARLHTLFLLLPCPVPLLGWGWGQWMPALFLVNTGLYLSSALLGEGRIRAAARELAVVSGVGLAASLPTAWVTALLPVVTPEQWAFSLIGGYALTGCWRLRHPGVGIASGLLLMVFLAPLTRGSIDGTLAVQAGLAWMVAHSLRWSGGGTQDQHDAVRRCVAIVWMGHSLLFTWNMSGPDATCMSLVSAGVVCAWWFHARQHPAGWRLSVPASAAFPLLAAPVQWLVTHSSKGMLAMGVSFVLFGIGALLARTRARWEARS